MAAELNLEERELCSDGACIGVIGGDGRCKECGKPGKGGPKRGAARKDDVAPDEDESDDDDSMDAAGGESETSDVDDEDRALCPDGACIGVIGDDGRCKVCGTAKE